jgi:hypothetical protein
MAAWGNLYCTVDVGTAVAMERTFGATSKRLPEWLISPRKCDFVPKNKQKLRSDYMIVEITHMRLTGFLRNRIVMGTLMSLSRLISDPGNNVLLSWGNPLAPGTWTKS